MTQSQSAMKEDYMFTLEELEMKARKIRATCVQMAYDAQETHLSSALSCADILTVLFGGFLDYKKGAMSKDENRDRFILSKGHACSALYATMASFGIISTDLLKTYGHTDSPLSNHPCKHVFPYLEVSTGSLGHGLGIAGGIGYSLKLKGNSKNIIAVLMSDAECNEGSVWEAAMFAVAKKLNNLMVIIDYNGTQAVGKSDDIMGYTSIEEKFISFGWDACTVDGNSIQEFKNALSNFDYPKNFKPLAVIAKTKTAAGIKLMEGKHFWYYRRPTRDDLKEALYELNEKPLYS
jgi:transketolase